MLMLEADRQAILARFANNLLRKLRQAIRNCTKRLRRINHHVTSRTPRTSFVPLL
jgi:hypothetical protein